LIQDLRVKWFLIQNLRVRNNPLLYAFVTSSPSLANNFLSVLKHFGFTLIHDIYSIIMYSIWFNQSFCLFLLIYDSLYLNIAFISFKIFGLTLILLTALFLFLYVIYEFDLMSKHQQSRIIFFGKYYWKFFTIMIIFKVIHQGLLSELRCCFSVWLKLLMIKISTIIILIFVEI
jgi:hypothetical protein